MRRTTLRPAKRRRRQTAPVYGAAFGLEFLDVAFPPEPTGPLAQMTNREILLDTGERVIALNHWHTAVNRALVALHVQDERSTTDRTLNRAAIDEARLVLDSLTMQTHKSDFRQKLLTVGIGIGGAVASAVAGFGLHHFFG